MRVIKLLFLFLGIFSIQTLSAQDIHFTQYNMSPLTLNPAHAGKFQGTVRIGGIYREQWRSVIKSNRFTTPSAWVDAPIFKGFRRSDWVGVGLMIFQDKAGTGGLINGAFKISGAYHLALDKKGNTMLALAGTWGSGWRKLNYEKLLFEDGILASGGVAQGVYDPTKSADFNPSQLDAKPSFKDIDAGVILTSKLNKKMDVNIGVSMMHLTRGAYSVLAQATSSNPNPQPTSSDNEKQPRRMIIHGQFNVEMNKRMTFNPTFMFQSMSGADEIILQAMTGYKLNPTKDIILHGGIGYRMRDAANLLLGMTKGPLRVGVAYDVNVSSLSTVSNYRGGWELAANYIIKIYKPAVVKPKVICPRY